MMWGGVQFSAEKRKKRESEPNEHDGETSKSEERKKLLTPIPEDSHLLLQEAARQAAVPRSPLLLEFPLQLANSHLKQLLVSRLSDEGSLSERRRRIRGSHLLEDDGRRGNTFLNEGK